MVRQLSRLLATRPKRSLGCLTIGHSSELEFSHEITVAKSINVLNVMRMGLGKAVSELVRCGFSLPCATCSVNGLQVFDLSAESPRITAKKVRELEAELE